MTQEELQKIIEIIYGSDIHQAFMRGYAQGYAAAKLEPAIAPFNPYMQPLRDAFGTPLPISIQPYESIAKYEYERTT